MQEVWFEVAKKTSVVAAMRKKPARAKTFKATIPNPAFGGSPSSSAMPKPPAAGDDSGTEQPAIGNESDPNLTLKYIQSSVSWQFFFLEEQVGGALKEFMKLNIKKPFLQRGTQPIVHGSSICLKWRSEVKGKSVYGWFREHAPRTFGTHGSHRFLNFAPCGTPDWQQPSPLASPNSAAIGAPKLAMGAAPDAETVTELYDPLPAEFARASFEASCLDYGAAIGALDEFGFIVLRGMIPEHLRALAYKEATGAALAVMKSFEHGYSIDKGIAGFDELHKLPSQVWEKKPPKKVSVIFQPAVGGIGLKLDKRTLLVHEVAVSSQAESKGVLLGWKAVKFDGEPAVGGSLPTWLDQDGNIDKSRTIVFMIPSHYNPLAESQKWGVSTSRGYQPRLGLGKCTDPVNFAKSPGLMNTQLWMRQPLAALHQCLPTELCWQPDGISFKAGGSSFSGWSTFSGVQKPLFPLFLRPRIAHKVNPSA